MLEHLLFASRVLAFAAWLLFVVEYQLLTRGDWRLTGSGRNIMALSVAIVVSLALMSFNSVAAEIGLVVAGVCLALIGVQRVRLLFEVQGRKRQREHYRSKERRRAE